MSLHPYLFFTNTCREAMTHYQQVLGGRLDVMTFRDLPESGEMPPGDVDPDLVMHAALTLDDGDLLMASDDPSGDGAGTKGAAINITLADAERARQVFDGLASGGQISMPLGETFWSPLFGMCTDRFGVAWMVDVESETAS